MRKNKLTYDYVKNHIESLGYILISNEYINAHSKLVFKDFKGYYYSVSYISLYSNHLPNKFHQSNPYTIQNIKLWCKLNNKPFELIHDQEYIRASEKLKWRCFKDGCGEIFQANWNSIITDCGCGVCDGRQVTLSNCLATKNPELAKEWHPTLNGELTPYDFTCGSREYVWWQCKDNPKHEWGSVIVNRINGNGCPYCSGFYASEDYNLLIDNPKLCEEWDYNKNDKNPEEYCLNSHQEVWWKCQINPKHEWSAQISNRNFSNHGCPYCSGHLPSEENNLAVLNPELAKEWHPTKNGDLNPWDVTKNSGQSVWWICEKGHEWSTAVDCRSNGTGCPECNETKGEVLISNILNIYNISNTSQFRIKECRSKRPLPFDHAIFSDIEKTDLIFLVEFDGHHHFKPVCFGGISEERANENLKITQFNDEIKDQYCLENNIPLLRIHYKDLKNIPSILTTELQKYNLLKMNDIHIDNNLPSIILDSHPLTSPNNLNIL